MGRAEGSAATNGARSAVRAADVTAPREGLSCRPASTKELPSGSSGLHAGAGLVGRRRLRQVADEALLAWDRREASARAAELARSAHAVAHLVWVARRIGHLARHAGRALGAADAAAQRCGRCARARPRLVVAGRLCAARSGGGARLGWLGTGRRRGGGRKLRGSARRALGRTRRCEEARSHNQESDGSLHERRPTLAPATRKVCRGVGGAASSPPIAARSRSAHRAPLRARR